MAPKKKGNKKAQDNWEDDLGESIVPQAVSYTHLTLPTNREV